VEKEKEEKEWEVEKKKIMEVGKKGKEGEK
jgi:hypothetical protein